MKLEIENSENGMNDLWFRIDNNFVRNGVRIKSFNEDDVMEYFGDKIYRQFIKGKNKFTITKEQYFKIINTPTPTLSTPTL